MQTRLTCFWICLAVLALQGCVAPPESSGSGEPGLALRQPQDRPGDNTGSRGKIVKKESVYFARQSSIIDASAHRTLEKLAMLMRMDKTLYAHLSGSSDHLIHNPSLALRRAIAVRNVLSQMGVPLNRIAVKDETKTSTILSQQQAESSADADDRRVDIVLDAVVGQEI